MPSKAHLRQRHGSDALRLDRFDRDDSPFNPEDDDVASNPPLSAKATKSRGQSPNGFSKHHRSRSSAFLSPRLPQQTFEDDGEQDSTQPTQQRSPSPYQYFPKLPMGAVTPSIGVVEATPIDGPGVVIFPPPPPSWSNMPNKGQLAILALSRFVDFFQMAALQTYMVHQLKSFDPSLPDSVISHQAGVLQGSFTAAQIVTSILWGRAADQPGVGRKLVLTIGLFGTGFTMLGVGFSTTYTQAVVWRMLGGAINGTVGSARTMVAESVEKPWHPRAFLLLPAAFNFANVAGPILGGLLVDPFESYPKLFGPASTFGGHEGVIWMKNYPYAVANLLSTSLLWAEGVLVIFFLRETLKGYRKMEISRFDPVRIVTSIWDGARGMKRKGSRMMTDTAMLKRGLLSGREETSIELDRIADMTEDLDRSEKSQPQRPTQRLPFRRIWTSNVLWTLLTIAIFDFHMGAFANLWILFLSTDREFVPDMDQYSELPDSAPANVVPAPDAGLTRRFLDQLTANSALDQRSLPRSPFKFAGGLAFPPPTIGFAMAIIGFIGIGLQFLLYPHANARFGLMRCFRSSLFLFPLAYFLAPYISILPSSSPSPNPASGVWVWAGISMVVTLQVAARTFALPASIILLNNSSPHPSVLATIHGLGQADSATFRTLGPMLSGMWYGTWLERGVVGMAWWIVAAISAIGCVASFKVRNGNGHEILLPGEEGREEGGGPSGQR